MSLAAAQLWNTRYSQEKQVWLARPPKQLLLDYEALLSASGRVLDAAAGVGASGKYLAKKRLTVFSLDISIEGLKLAQRDYQNEDVEFIGAVMDLSIANLPQNYFDVILNFCFLERATFEIYRKSLKSDGLIFFETFVKDSSDIVYPDHYLEPGELLSKFSDFEIIHYDQVNRKTKNGVYDRKVVQLVARKRPK